MTIKALIEVLNNLTAGELSRVCALLDEVRAEVRAIGHDEIRAILDEAVAALESGDLKTFRRKLQHAVSRLGHVKVHNVGVRP